MEVPNNPAEALERLLLALVQPDQGSVADSWASTLDAQVGSSEFVTRHSAVVGLVNNLQAYLEALPDGHVLKTRHLADIPVYYQAVVYRGDWNASINFADHLIRPDLIRLLGGLGTNIRVMGGGTVVEDDDVAKLRASLDEWEARLDSAGLPDGLVDQIRAQLRTIHDLLDQAPILSYTPVIREVQSLFGMGMRALTQAQNAYSLITAVTGLFEFLTHLHLGDWGSAANVLNGAFSMMGEALAAAQQPSAGPSAIESAEQPALEAAKDHNSESSDTIDAEVVEAEDESSSLDDLGI